MGTELVDILCNHMLGLSDVPISSRDPPSKPRENFMLYHHRLTSTLCLVANGIAHNQFSTHPSVSPEGRQPAVGPGGS